MWQNLSLQKELKVYAYGSLFVCVCAYDMIIAIYVILFSFTFYVILFYIELEALPKSII